MAQIGNYNSAVTPNGPNGYMSVGGTDGNYTVTYASTACTVDQSASHGNSLRFTYVNGGSTYQFNGACANSTYNGMCVQQSPGHAPKGPADDNWTATSAQPAGSAKGGRH